jgi:hypothetical protein
MAAAETDHPRPVEQFKPTSGMFVGYAGLAVAAVLLVSVLTSERSLLGLQLALGAVFFGALIWATQLRPRATAYPRHVVLRNSVRDAHVPLAEIDEVSVRQFLTVHAGNERYVCIGIGSNRRQEMRSRRRREVGSGMSRLSELTVKAEKASYDARAVSYPDFVAGRLEELVDQAKQHRTDPGPDEPAKAHYRWSWPEIVVLAVTGLAFVASLFL